MALLALLCVYFIWGSTYLGIRIAISGYPPFLMAGLRNLLASTLLLLWLKARRVPWPTRGQWLAAAAVGGLLLVGGNGGVVFAEQTVSSSLAALIVSVVPLWMVVFEGLLGGPWPQPLEWVGLALGLAGVGLLQFEGDLRASPAGAVALVVASMSWAFGSVWSRRLKLPPAGMSSAAQMLSGGCMLLVLGTLVGERLPRGPVRPQATAALVYLAVIGSIVAFSAYVYLLRRLKPAVVGTYAFVNPVVAVVLGVGLAGERIAPVGVAGTLVILSGVGLITLRRLLALRAAAVGPSPE
ncbi:MAG TPA: drug/metabolite exporter YedA [Candidatus Saccharimonadales bacterium]|nr:drug/metabolite exporter YedA [Candidatus Saccharimonadales bacterium]